MTGRSSIALADQIGRAEGGTAQSCGPPAAAVAIISAVRAATGELISRREGWPAERDRRHTPSGGSPAGTRHSADQCSTEPREATLSRSGATPPYNSAGARCVCVEHGPRAAVRSATRRPSRIRHQITRLAQQPRPCNGRYRPGRGGSRRRNLTQTFPGTGSQRPNQIETVAPALPAGLPSGPRVTQVIENSQMESISTNHPRAGSAPKLITVCN